MIEYVFAALIVFMVLLILLYRRLWIRLNSLKLELRDALSQKKSLSSRYGKLTEQFIPFLKEYPYNEQNFRFIGSPVDGVQFEDDKIVLMEFKTAGGRLTDKQKRIRELVRRGRVFFEEFRISGD